MKRIEKDSHNLLMQIVAITIFDNLLRIVILERAVDAYFFLPFLAGAAALGASKNPSRESW